MIYKIQNGGRISNLKKGKGNAKGLRKEKVTQKGQEIKICIP